MNATNEPLLNPYTKGKTLALTVRGMSSRNALPHTNVYEKELRVSILDVIEPSTMSVVLRVKLELDDHTVPMSTMVLKVFDRHFSTEMREFKDAGPATQANESHYVDFVRACQMPEFVAAFEKDGLEAFDEWDTGKREAYCYYRSALSHEIELEIYERLITLQGVHIPRIFANVRLSPHRQQLQPEETLMVFFETRAILMEYVDGFSLDEIVKRTPESDWAPICDQAIEVINTISESDFINCDVKTRNILVRRPEDKAYEVFFLDFGECRFRDPSDSDEVWRERKRQRCEEGAVGYIMMNHISRAKGKKGKKYKGNLPLPWEYAPSKRFEGEYIELYDNAE